MLKDVPEVFSGIVEVDETYIFGRPDEEPEEKG
jgi:hypothetical protein